MLRKIKTVACGISGGVDSAIAAHFLKLRGYEVIGVFMKNWDEVDEFGVCRSDKEYEDAQYICNRLRIPLLHVNFVKEYWNLVFSSFLADYEMGLTPNPDILCNKHIKFDIFLNHCIDNLGVDAVASGHYAKTSAGLDLHMADLSKGVKLLQPKDRIKDQTFFLSQIPQQALHKVMFPLHDIKKNQVKDIARSIGLEKIADKKESMGICYIGNRNFQKFIEGYIEAKPGYFVDIETGNVIGRHHGVHMWTLGQRTRTPGYDDAWFVHSKDPKTQTIYVTPACVFSHAVSDSISLTFSLVQLQAKGTDHLSLFYNSLITSQPYWICGPPKDYEETNKASVKFKVQHPHPTMDCTINKGVDCNITISFEQPYRVQAPGQFSVFYGKEEVFGSARILALGPSLYCQNIKTRLKKGQFYS